VQARDARTGLAGVNKRNPCEPATNTGRTQRFFSGSISPGIRSNTVLGAANMKVQPRRSSPCQAFTLVELLVVTAIIAIVLAIVVPALSSVRTSARSTESRGLADSVSKAILQFRNDNNQRTPGVFSAKQLGAQDNEGVTPLFNALVELVGGLTDKPVDGTNVFTFGPQSSSKTGSAKIDLSALGSQGKYFSIPKKYWITEGSGRVAKGAGNQALPDLVDAFKTPLLMWAEDETFVGTPTQPSEFAALDSTDAAKCYWESNAPILKSAALGVKAENQTYAGQQNYSLLGAGMEDNALVQSLAGFLGHPAFPYRPANAQATYVPVVAAKSRGGVIIHSAGPDGIFLNANDRGGKQFNENGSSTVFNYKLNFVTTETGTLPGAGYTDRDGKPTNIDLIERFDDVVAVYGG
jgi:prepilin-type N-terminal cleavage/methylation domain-containing protein